MKRRLLLVAALLATTSIAEEPSHSEWHTEGIPVYVPPQQPLVYWHSFITPEHLQSKPKRPITFKASTKADAVNEIGIFCRTQLGAECAYTGPFEGSFVSEETAKEDSE